MFSYTIGYFVVAVIVFVALSYIKRKEYSDSVIVAFHTLFSLFWVFYVPVFVAVWLLTKAVWLLTKVVNLIRRIP